MTRCKPSDYYETPPELFKKLDVEFHFTYDVCATRETSKVPNFFMTEAEDALKHDWSDLGQTVWCNPPYSKEGKKDEFIRKAYEASLQGTTTVMLLPVKTDTHAFHKYIWNRPSVDVRFLPGRIRFWQNGKPMKSTGRFASMIVIFYPPEYLDINGDR